MYPGKSLPKSFVAEENIIAGNVCLYGATDGTVSRTTCTTEVNPIHFIVDKMLPSYFDLCRPIFEESQQKDFVFAILVQLLYAR